MSSAARLQPESGSHCTIAAGSIRASDRKSRFKGLPIRNTYPALIAGFEQDR
jgi:hypothetical protein